VFLIGAADGSGDHDAMVPHLGTQAWVRSLGFPIVDDWRAWHLQGQSAGLVLLVVCLVFHFTASDVILLSNVSSMIFQVHHNLLEQHDIRNY
jgi:hypothetical protein